MNEDLVDSVSKLTLIVLVFVFVMTIAVLNREICYMKVVGIPSFLSEQKCSK